MDLIDTTCHKLAETDYNHKGVKRLSGDISLLLEELDAAKAENKRLRRRNKMLHQKARLWLNRVNEYCDEYVDLNTEIARQRRTIGRLVDVLKTAYTLADDEYARRRIRSVLIALCLTWDDAIGEDQ